MRRNTKTVDVTAILFDPIWSFPLLSASFRSFSLLFAPFRPTLPSLILYVPDGALRRGMNIIATRYGFFK